MDKQAPRDTTGSFMPEQAVASPSCFEEAGASPSIRQPAASESIEVLIESTEELLESIEVLLEYTEELLESIEELLESIEEVLESITELIDCNYHKNHVGEIYGLIWALLQDY